LNSSPPSSNLLGEDSASTLITWAASATKETATTGTSALKTPSSILTASNTDTTDPFKLGDNLFDSTIEKSDAAGSTESNSTAHALDGSVLVEESSVQKEQDSMTLSKDAQSPTSPLDKDDQQLHLVDHISDKGSEDQLLAGEKSPPSDDGRTRANRQRRRIAGGVISLPVPSKALLSKSSTGSLSNAFQESASSSTAETADSDAPMTITGQAKDSGAHEQKIHSFEQHENSSHQATTTKMRTKKITTMTTATAEEVVMGCTDESKGIEQQVGEDTVVRAARNDDIVAKTIIADVELDATASEVSSLLTKSPPEGGHGTTMQEEEQQREGGERRESADQDDPSASRV